MADYAGNGGKSGSGKSGNDGTDNADRRTPEGLHIITPEEVTVTTCSYVRLTPEAMVKRTGDVLCKMYERKNCALADFCIRECATCANRAGSAYLGATDLDLLFGTFGMHALFKMLYPEDGGIPPVVDEAIVRGFRKDQDREGVSLRDKLVEGVQRHNAGIIDFCDTVLAYRKQHFENVADELRFVAAAHYELLRRQAAADSYGLGLHLNG